MAIINAITKIAAKINCPLLNILNVYIYRQKYINFQYEKCINYWRIIWNRTRIG